MKRKKVTPREKRSARRARRMTVRAMRLRGRSRRKLHTVGVFDTPHGLHIIHDIPRKGK